MREPPLKPLKHLILSALYICVLAAMPAYAENPAEEPHVKIRLLPERSEIKPGETITIGIKQTIDPHWHTYWLNPGDSGVAPEITWTLPENFAAGEIEWPTPHKIPFGPLTNYGYEDHAVLLQSLTIPAHLPEGALTLKAEITVLVCKDICIPETSTHTLTFNDSTNVDNSALITEARAKLPRTTDWPATYTEEKGDLIVTINSTNSGELQDIQADTPALIPYEWGLVDNTAATSAKAESNHMALRQKRGDRALGEISSIRTLLTYTDKNGQYQGVTLIASPAAAAATVTAPPNPAPVTKSISMLTALFFALVGGLILNLMPCVFPVLSLKAISLSKMSDKEQTHAAASGLAYTAGIILTFALIAGILMALKSAGAQIGWGFQLQSPVVVYALALLLFVIGLNLSGVFLLQGGFTNAGQKLTQQSGLRGAFFTGVLATLVATPCTAPFMGAAMGYALTQSAVAGMTIFIALGLGLALPYLLLTLVPPLRKMLPRPGHWMQTFKEFLAFPMYASAAWLVWVFAQQTGSMAILAALFGMVAVAFTLWAWPRRPQQKTARAVTTLLILLTLAGGLTIGFDEAFKPAAKTDTAVMASDGFWEHFSQSRLDELLQGNDPIFVDMTAAWCITCKMNERIALNIPETRALFTAQNIKALQGDWTNQNPEITKFLESHGRKGVPLYVFYGPRDPAAGTRPAPEILPQILTPAIVADAVQK